LQKLNITLNKSLGELEFGTDNFLQIEDIKSVSPMVKDYTLERVPLIHPLDYAPFSVNYMLDMARKKDDEGKCSHWYMRGGK